VDDKEIPTLGYAPCPPRPMRNKIIFAATIGAAGIAVTAAGMMYRASRATSMRTGGVIVHPNITWQTQPAGNSPATQPDLMEEPASPAALPSGGDSTNNTATTQ
jgi:hypothetical protein